MKAYLDIETDRQGNVCVIGIFSQPGGFVQFYGDDVTADNLGHALSGAKTIVTFNGDCFDLPTLDKYFNLDLKGSLSLPRPFQGEEEPRACAEASKSWRRCTA